MVERRFGDDVKKRDVYLRPEDLADLIKEMRGSLLKSIDGGISSPTNNHSCFSILDINFHGLDGTFFQQSKMQRQSI